jgi:triphosphoribosyl-dephospho-CoA synthetase
MTRLGAQGPPNFLWDLVSKSFATAFVLEAVSPKVSGVTSLEGLKGMTILEFVQSSYHIRDGIRELLKYDNCIPLGRSLLGLMKSVMDDPLIKTNTCLGYGLTSFSLASTILYSLRGGYRSRRIENLVHMGYSKFEECSKREPPEDLLESIATASPSYHGSYSRSSFSNVYELLKESAMWDIIAFNVVNKFVITMEIFNYVRTARNEELVDKISKAYRISSSKYRDSIVFKSSGLMLSEFVMMLASQVELEDSELRRVLTKVLDVNLGSISDLVASSVALALIERVLGWSI